jgi:hypothetical protein
MNPVARLAREPKQLAAILEVPDLLRYLSYLVVSAPAVLSAAFRKGICRARLLQSERFVHSVTFKELGLERVASMVEVDLRPGRPDQI